MIRVAGFSILTIVRLCFFFIIIFFLRFILVSCTSKFKKKFIVIFMSHDPSSWFDRLIQLTQFFLINFFFLQFHHLISYLIEN